jgi:hypothetical protein
VLFGNAFLVFVLQPHISKRLLPVLGGSAEVWIVCTLFFQLALLAGYALAHLARRLPLAPALIGHAALVAVALVLWPFGADDGPPVGSAPAWWALQLLVGEVGLLFAMLTATSPLLQMAYARAMPGLDPYPLFAASNAGSLAGVFAYPVLVEPFLRLQTQALAWTSAAVLLVALLLVTGGGLARRWRAAPEATAAAADPTSWRQRLRWLALSMVPSVLLLAVTAQITTDIAPIPLLWTVPLALYLGSFIRVFRHGWQPSRWTWTVMAVCSLPTLLAFSYEPNQVWWAAVHLTLLWCGAVLCHGTLVQERPGPERLSEFYLWLALGGALGGAFAGLVAPLVFAMRFEYPLAVLAVLWLGRRPSSEGVALRLSWPVALGLAAIGILAAAALAWSTSTPPGLETWFVLVPSAAALVNWHRPRLFAACASLALLAVVAGRQVDPNGVVLRGRTFYGTHAVRELPDAQVRALFHGTTLHGLQSLRPERRHDPLSYYGQQSPVADVFRERADRTANVAVIGLGTGSLLRFATPGTAWTMFEIDPAIAHIARDATLFAHWAEAAVTPALVIGDGRLRMREMPDAAFDLIVVDAFSSDAVPVHLLTREAQALFSRKLRPGGAMLFHVSNRYIELATVVAATARQLDLVAWQRYDGTDDVTLGVFPSTWVLVGPPPSTQAPTAEWTIVEASASDRAWSDDYSNVFTELRPVRLLREIVSGLIGY